MEQDILHTISYFANFQYPPTVIDLYRFHTQACSLSEFHKRLRGLIERGVVVEKKYQRDNYVVKRYTLRGYTSFFKIWRERYDNTYSKYSKLYPFVPLLSIIPSIRLIGLSGSMSMVNAGPNDDIDIFIITAKGRLWTVRLIALVLALILGRHRRRGLLLASNTICLNLFFAENDMRLPPDKHTEYGAHEVLQMRPLFNRHHTYERFLDANRWVYDLFPNALKKPVTDRRSETVDHLFSSVSAMVEHILASVQLWFMRSHRTTERITATQLWFFPHDFENRLKAKKTHGS